MEANVLLYTEEQEEKIKKLRQQNIEEKETKINLIKINKERNILFPSPKEGDAVFVKFGDKEISGYINKIIEKKETYFYTRKLVHTKKIKYFDIKTPLGNVLVTNKNFKRRYVEDLSNVIIPEKLKLINTRQLLYYLKIVRLGGSYSEFSRQEIKAELSTRPHIESIKEKKKFLKFKNK